MSDKVDVDAMVDKWLSDDSDTGTDTATTEGTPDAGTPDAEPTEGTPQQPAEANAATDQPTSEPAKPGSDKEPSGQQVQKSGPGDLVDRDGKVVARAGAERRHYEAATKFKTQLEQVNGQLDRTRGELEAFRTAAQLPTQLGLNPEESTTGLQLIASWKTNPVGVIQYLVEQAKAAGHNLETLGGATDIGAIKQMIAQELQPIRQQAQSEQRVQEAQTAAQQQVQALVSEYGEQALNNGDALSKLINASIEQGRPLNLEQAYLRFNNWCYQNGFDPANPIDPQIAARRTPPPATQQSQPPRPNGRAVAAPNGVVPMDHAAGITGNENTRDLVRAAMREQGFNV